MLHILAKFQSKYEIILSKTKTVSEIYQYMKSNLLDI